MLKLFFSPYHCARQWLSMSCKRIPFLHPNLRYKVQIGTSLLTKKSVRYITMADHLLPSRALIHCPWWFKLAVRLPTMSDKGLPEELWPSDSEIESFTRFAGWFFQLGFLQRVEGRRWIAEEKERVEQNKEKRNKRGNKRKERKLRK